MQDPTELFQFESDTSPSMLQELQASVLVVALGGFIDAGNTQRLMADHLLETHESRGMPTMTACPFRGWKKITWIESARERSGSCPSRASEPTARIVIVRRPAGSGV